MLFLPFRTKNPPERIPYLTYTLIAVNILVYALTSDGLTIRETAVEQFAITHNNWSLLRLLTAMFLHGNLLHLAGNMLFLWIFGCSIEGRLGPVKYLPVYLLSGMAGGVLQDITLGLIKPDIPSLGASGAVMGLAGMYLYLFPHATICVLFSWWTFHLEVVEWPAWGVIAYFLGFDILEGLLFMGADGVGHFAHLGGAAAGYLMMVILREKRDTAEYSEAQQVRDELGDNYHLMGLSQLEALMDGPALNNAMVVAYIHKAVRDYGANAGTLPLAVEAIHKHYRRLLDTDDPVTLTQAILTIPEGGPPLPGILLLRLASRLEQHNNYGLAIPLFQRLYRQNPNHPDAEMALLRLARISERGPDKQQAIAQYHELLRLFPNGAQAFEARAALQRLGGLPRPDSYR